MSLIDRELGSLWLDGRTSLLLLSAEDFLLPSNSKSLITKNISVPLSILRAELFHLVKIIKLKLEKKARRLKD